jgi:hypothetical protein
MHTDDGLVLVVSYEGNGSALVTIEGVNGSYADAGTYEIEKKQTFTLAQPENSSGVRVTVETSRGKFVRTVVFETVTANATR